MLFLQGTTLKTKIMEGKEDPLEKLERQQSQKNRGNSGLKTVMIAMIVVAALLAAALVYVLISKDKLVGQLNDEKKDLTEQIVSLQSDYEGLSSNYDAINSQLDSSREEIAQLVDRVKKTDATNRSKIRQYQKELGTLRSIMRNYIVQIDSLNTLNHQLTQEAASARKDAAESKQLNVTLNQKVEDLTGRVSAGAVLKARAISMTALTSGQKSTDRSSRVARLLVNLSLVENELAERGPVRVYVSVTSPDGKVLEPGEMLVVGDQTVQVSASREVDYQGAEVDMGIYVNNIPSFTKGVYTVKVYSAQAFLGSAELMLR